MAFSFLAVGAFSTVPTPLYGLYEARDGFGAVTLTVIFAAYAAGVVTSLFLIGHLSDVLGRRRVLVLGLVVNLLAALVFLAPLGVAGLLLGRFANGLGVGAIAATATAWLAELDAHARPEAADRRAQLVATAMNLGGLGIGALIAGLLAQWVPHPLVVPYLVAILALAAGLVLVLAAAPETRPAASPRPRWRPQRVSVPAHARGAYVAAAVGALISFAAFGLFTSLAPSFLASTLHQSSRAVAGATAFLVFAAGILAQLAMVGRPLRSVLAVAIAGTLVGLLVVVGAVWLPSPSLALFLLGGAITGGGGGLLFQGTIGTVADISDDATRAEALAGLFLAAYVGLSLPVIGLGVLTRHVSVRASLLVFVSLLAAAIVASAPALLARRRPA